MLATLAVGAMANGAAGKAKTVNDAKAVRKQLDETICHHRAMEERRQGKRLRRKRDMEGQGLYLAPYRCGAGLKRRRGGRRKTQGNRQR